MMIKKYITAGIMAAVILSVAGLGSPLLAASKSKTIDISCVILPMVQFSSLLQSSPSGDTSGGTSQGAAKGSEFNMSVSGPSFSIVSNLGNGYTVTEDLNMNKDGQLVRSLSVTEL